VADFGIVTTSTQYTMQPAELGRWLEAHGFESLWFGEHSHIPTSRKSPYPGANYLTSPRNYLIRLLD
jgi:alkanesulfonate monooxygenase SsuD/methylene tetrahydromethanopterin reductase-like flavin-dependent oxidoreductase (luciferase family)